MDLLLDVNIVVDICAPREEFEEEAINAITLCEQKGWKIWVYAGTVQTMEYVLFYELKRQYASAGIQATNRQISHRTKALLNDFCQDKNWLAALAGEGPVFDAQDPEDEQLLQALKRFPQNSIKLLTRDEPILKKHPELSVSPEKYLNLILILHHRPSWTFLPSRTKSDPTWRKISTLSCTTANISWDRKSQNWNKSWLSLQIAHTA